METAGKVLKTVSSVAGLGGGVISGGLNKNIGTRKEPEMVKSGADIASLATGAFDAVAGFAMDTIGSIRSSMELSRQQNDVLTGRAIENFRFELEHKKIRMQQAHSIRELGTIRERATVNVYDVAKKTCELLGTTEVHIRSYLPSEQQMLLINSHYERFGVDCLVPNY